MFVVAPRTGISPPVATIATPADGSEVQAPTAITGSVSSAALAYWTLSYQLQGSNAPFTVFARGTNTVSNAAIGTLDTTLLDDGQYNIALTAVDQANAHSCRVQHA